LSRRGREGPGEGTRAEDEHPTSNIGHPTSNAPLTLALSPSEGEREAAPADHPLVWEARLDLAFYDANPTEQARCLDRLLQLFPGNPTRLLRRLSCLRNASREERIQFLAQACAANEADPALFIELARALNRDARR